MKQVPYAPEVNPPKPREATCRTALDPSPIGFWKLALSIEWGTPGDASTTMTIVAWLDREGNSNGTFGAGIPPA